MNFLPQDATFASYGVIKVPDAQPEQLGFEGQFLPTYAFTTQTGPYSAFPDALNPALTLLSCHGNLGIDDGRPQSVYDLDKTNMRPFKKADGKGFRVDLTLGQRVKLPNGGGTISFDRVDRWVKLQVSESPGKRIGLAGALIGIVGLLGSLYIRPRRVWAYLDLRRPDSPGGHRAGSQSARRPSKRHRRPDRTDTTTPRGETHDLPTPTEAAMSAANFADFSDNAIMFASIVYVLAFLAHLTEWVFLRSVPLPIEQSATALVGVGATADPSSRDAAPTGQAADGSVDGSSSAEALRALGAHRSRARSARLPAPRHRSGVPRAGQRSGPGALGQHV
ncbi:hypothetical protein GCM10027596_39660 [Nocardioides korecus]